MLLTTEAFQRCFNDFTVTDCVVRSRDVFCFVAVSNYDTDDVPPPDEQRTTRVLVYCASEPKLDRWKKASFAGFNGLLAGAALRPKEQFIGVDGDGRVLSVGSGAKELEQRIPRSKNGPQRGGVRKLRTFNGYVYVSTGYRGLGKREDTNRWVTLCNTLQFDPDPDASSDEFGFDDFDAFDTNDIYCVGGQGDVWHFDGRSFRQLDFPSNMYLESVCCAGDGSVYIGAQNGSIFKGRDDTWRLLQRDNLVLPFNDMVWFQDRVYCTSDHGLWEIRDDAFREANVPDSIKVCSGNLSVADGVMLLAGVFGAAYHDGSGWTQLFDTMTFTGLNPPP